MKNVIFAVSGFCAAAAGFLIWRSTRIPPVTDLAHRLEDAWADHRTVA